jgi:hypothetical protein
MGGSGGNFTLEGLDADIAASEAMVVMIRDKAKVIWSSTTSLTRRWLSVSLRSTTSAP